MKHLIAFASLSLMTFASSAATLQSATLDSSNKYLVLEVTHAGGCGKHEFSLKIPGCAESNPVQCSAQLVHVTDDPCEALISSTVVIPLSRYKLDTSYYKGGSLTITGDLDGSTGKPSTAHITLP